MCLIRVAICLMPRIHVHMLIEEANGYIYVEKHICTAMSFGLFSKMFFF